MSKNVGVSQGCPWKHRRKINEVALDTDKLHIYSEKYNNDIYEQLLKWKDKENLDYNNFFKLGKKMVAKIIFNTEPLVTYLPNNITELRFSLFLIPRYGSIEPAYSIPISAFRSNKLFFIISGRECRK